MNLDKLDRIVLTMDQTQSIAEWNLKNPQAERGFPLLEGLLIITDIDNPLDKGLSGNMGTYFKLDEDTGSMEVRTFELSEPEDPLVTVVLDEDFYNEGKLKVKSKYKQLSEDYLQKVAKTNVMLLLDTFVYMINAKEKVVVSSEIKRKSKPVKGKKKTSSKKNRIVKISSKKYIIDFAREEPTEKRDYNRQADSWTVRGHWRYYEKTGKRVWIKGYKKGQGEQEGKEYRL